METTPIPVPAHRTRSSWQIPLPKEVVYHDQTRSFKSIEAEILDMGFQRVFTTHSLPHSAVNRGQSEDGPREYVVWYHPAGVFAQGHSYETRVYGSATNEKVRTIESITLTTAIDFPTGNERRHQSACMVKGSGSTNYDFDGSCIRLASTTVGVSRGESLAEALKNWQQAGRFLPPERWPIEHYVFLPAECLLPILSLETQDHEEPSKVLEPLTSQRRALEEAFLGQLPEDVRAPFVSGFRWESKDTTNALDWTAVEYSLRETSEVLGLSRKLWPTLAEKALLKHWVEVALGRHGDEVENWRPWEAGPCGISLPMVLLYASGFWKAQGRLLEVLEKAPAPVLLRWTSEVDGAGYTLPMRVLHRAFSKSSIEQNWATVEDLVEMLEVLGTRLPLDTMRWETPQRSMPGLLLQSLPNPSDSSGPKRFAAQSEVFWQVVDAAQGRGVQWDGGVRWRNYPNTMTDKETPAFFKAPEALSPEALVAHLGPSLSEGQVPPALTRVFLQLRSHRLEEVFSSTETEVAPARPKMRF